MLDVHFLSLIVVDVGVCFVHNLDLQQASKAISLNRTRLTAQRQQPSLLCMVGQVTKPDSGSYRTSKAADARIPPDSRTEHLNDDNMPTYTQRLQAILRIPVTFM